MRHSTIIAVLFAAGVAASSCKSQFELLLASNDVEAKYKAAMEYYADGKYQKAGQLFESLSVLANGTERDDSIQFYWAMSNYKFKDYVSAETNFTSFVEHFPASVFTQEAKFLKLDCMYRGTYRYELDQTPTYRTITAISEYIVEYPHSDKIDVCSKMLDELGLRLDRKAYENARLYYRMEDYKAARVALMNVLKEDSDNVYREEILYLIAMSSYKYASQSVPAKQRERFLAFVDDYLNFVGEFPDSKHKAELDTLYRKVQKNNETSSSGAAVK